MKIISYYVCGQTLTINSLLVRINNKN